MQEEVHATESPCGAVRFLAVQRVVAARTPVRFLDLVGRADEERTGSAGGIANAIARLRVEQFGQKFRDAGRCVELAAFFSGVGGKALDQVHVRVADDVLIDDRRPEVEARIVEILE